MADKKTLEEGIEMKEQMTLKEQNFLDSQKAKIQRNPKIQSTIVNYFIDIIFIHLFKV